MKRTVSDEEKPKTGGFWKITGQVILYTFMAIAAIVWIRNEVANFDFQSWWNPFYTTERPKAAALEKPTVESLLRAVNAERVKKGAAPLKIDERLNQSAQAKADDMKKRNYFEHVDPDGKHGYEIAGEHNSECMMLGENLLQFTSDANNTAKTAVRDWVNSPTHYSLIIDPDFVSTGFGMAGRNIVQHFCQLK